MERIERRLKALENRATCKAEYLRRLCEKPTAYATQAQMDELLKVVKYLEQMTEQAGKPKRNPLLGTGSDCQAASVSSRMGLADSGHNHDGAGNAVHSVVSWLRRLEHDQATVPIMDATTTYYHSDSKALRKSYEKKVALGHNEKDHEDEQTYTWQRPCNGLQFIGIVSGRTSMKSEFELYMETGMVGAYQPDMAVLRKEPDGVMAVYRDTVFEQEDDCMTCKRFMMVGDRRFRVTSVFPDTASSTATQKYLSYIDSELSKKRTALEKFNRLVQVGAVYFVLPYRLAPFKEVKLLWQAKWINTRFSTADSVRRMPDLAIQTAY